MQGTHKKFNAQLHQQTDAIGILATIRMLNKTLGQFRHEQNRNQYGIDVLTFDSSNMVIAAWEVEVRVGNWKADVKFPFDTINCIERKDYLWQKHDKMIEQIDGVVNKNNFDVYYVQLNAPTTRACILKGEDILKYDKIKWSNRFVKDGEYVRQVPTSKAIQIKVPYHDSNTDKDIRRR